MINGGYTVFPDWKFEVELSIDNNDHQGWANVFSFRQSDVAQGEMGDRIPAAYLLPQSGQLRICSGINDNWSYCVDTVELELDKWYKIELSQLRQDNGDYIYNVIVDGVTYASVVNNNPKTFEAVVASFANNDNYVASGIYKNYRFTSFSRGSNIELYLVI